MGTPVAIATIVRSVSILVGALTIGCAAGRPAPRGLAVATTPPERLQWLEAAVARGDDLATVMRGAYVPRGTPGADMVCSLAIQIDAWYGVGDERWELTHATAFESDASEPMRRARDSRSMREELARIGIRDCILDLNR